MFQSVFKLTKVGHWVVNFVQGSLTLNLSNYKYNIRSVLCFQCIYYWVFVFWECYEICISITLITLIEKNIYTELAEKETDTHANIHTYNRCIPPEHLYMRNMHVCKNIHMQSVQACKRYIHATHKYMQSIRTCKTYIYANHTYMQTYIHTNFLNTQASRQEQSSFSLPSNINYLHSHLSHKKKKKRKGKRR